MSSQTALICRFFVSFVLFLALAGNVWAAGPTEKVLYSFPEGPSEIPSAGPILDSAGNLYGISTGEGSYAGAVWKLSPTDSGGWKKTNLYVFKGGRDGQNPYAPLTTDASGNFYGTTIYGGDGQACVALGYTGCGTVFKLTPQNNGTYQETVLYVFQGLPDGAWPAGGLALDKAGNLYGTTTAGGKACISNNNGCGVVFELSAHADGNYTESVIHTFTVPDGVDPRGTLIMDSAGSLYGTARGNEDLGTWGTIFRMSPSNGKWQFKVLHSFTDGDDGGAPFSGLTAAKDGIYYGTANTGGASGYGTVYELKHTKAAWKLTTLYAFPANNFSENPVAGVILDRAGNLYGTCEGDTDYGEGTAYELVRTSKSWRFKLLHTFGEQKGDGGYPVDYGTLAMDEKGNLYGTTTSGGKGVYFGTAFRIVP